MTIQNLHQVETVSPQRTANISITSYDQAVRQHHEMMRTGGYLAKAEHVMNLLATASVLTTSQLRSLIPISPRTLRRYQVQGLVLSTSYDSHLQKFALANGKHPRLWTLGLVGIARAVDLQLSAESFRGYPFKKTVHDVLLNEIVVELLSQAIATDTPHIWHGTYDGRVRDPQGDVLVEPDAVLLFGDGPARQGYAVEYHNEDDRRRVKDKIQRYESVQRNDHWRRFWDVSEMPTVVVATTHNIVLQGYIDALRERGQTDTRCRYVGSSFGRFTDNRHAARQWGNLNKIAFDGSREMVSLF